MTYTIWMCCGGFEWEDTREEAISFAASCMNGDGHRVWAVEGPDGEDLMAEAEAESGRQCDEWSKRSEETRQRLLGCVEVKGPTGKWWGRKYVYSTRVRDQDLAELRRIYGEDRVRFVEKLESRPYKSMGAIGRQ